MELSTDKVEYVAATACCSQLLWIKQQLKDFGVLNDPIPLMCDNTSALNMAKDHVHHKRIKHIDVCIIFSWSKLRKGTYA